MKRIEPNLNVRRATIDTNIRLGSDPDPLEKEKTEAGIQLSMAVDDLISSTRLMNLHKYNTVSVHDPYGNTAKVRRTEVSGDGGNVGYSYEMQPESGAEDAAWQRTVSWHSSDPSSVVASGVHEGRVYYYELGPEKIDEVREEISDLFTREGEPAVKVSASKFGFGVIQAGAKLVDRLKGKK